jgi:23S rRNA pseudouridine1911/1915/1917 synthase
MHQIRAHLAAIGHPVIGDTLYGGGRIPEGRHLLHARRIEFDHPESGERIVVESPLPEDFRVAAVRLGLAT